MARSNPIQIQKYLKGIDYPASKDDLIKHAKEHGADNETISVLNEIHEDEFNSPAEVSKAVGAVH